MGNKTVWVLGAGFSKPLGGPLLRDLLSRESSSRLKFAYAVKYPGTVNDSFLEGIRYVYNYGNNLSQGPDFSSEKPGFATGESHWSNPEEFLEKVDTLAGAPESSPQRRQLEALIRRRLDRLPELHDLKAFAGMARRRLAAECSAFLIDSDRWPERWEPYKKWANHLSPDDVILTFNYDLVLEKLDLGNNLEVILPGSERGLGGGNPKVLKLHGSIDWKRVVSGTIQEPGSPIGTPIVRFERTHDLDFALRCGDQELTIASPGASKLSIMGELEPLWALAEKALRDATRIIFVGYRFPPTDNTARHRLLEAIQANRQGHLVVHSVLGRGAKEDTDALRILLGYQFRLSNRLPAESGLSAFMSSSSVTAFSYSAPSLGAEEFLPFARGDVLEKSWI